MADKCTSHFSFNRRNPGHWDVCTSARRVFALRGGPGRYIVRDEREDRHTIPFEAKTIGACFQYIMEELTYELIIAEGQDFTVIEGWNV